MINNLKIYFEIKKEYNHPKNIPSGISPKNRQNQPKNTKIPHKTIKLPKVKLFTMLCLVFFPQRF
jgi:hypothetical protein